MCVYIGAILNDNPKNGSTQWYFNGSCKSGVPCNFNFWWKPNNFNIMNTVQPPSQSLPYTTLRTPWWRHYWHTKLATRRTDGPYDGNKPVQWRDWGAIKSAWLSCCWASGIPPKYRAIVVHTACRLYSTLSFFYDWRQRRHRRTDTSQ